MVARMLADPLTVLPRLRAEYGPVVRVPVGRGGFHLVCDPDAVGQVLVTSQRAFAKGFRRRTMPPGQGIQPLALLLGSGLLTSAGDLHRRRRRLIQPLFHRQRVAGYGDQITRLTDAAAAGWADGALVDLHAEMSELTLAIVARTVFDVGIDSDVIRRVRRAVHANLRLSRLAVIPGAIRLAGRRSIGPVRTAHLARQDLTNVVMEMIARRRAEGTGGADLLSLLIEARDAETGATLPDIAVRDEALTILLAGHETTANALSWAYYLLGRYPEAREKLHAELDEVLDGRLPTVNDLPALAYTRAVFNETMRLYPPAWILIRRTCQDVELAGFHIPAETTVLLSQWVVHRDPAWWPEPDAFRPERWLEPAPDRPRFAFFPFGGGTRQCIGNTFAELEGALVLATISRRLILDPAHRVTPVPRVTLRPRSLRMTAHHRPA